MREEEDGKNNKSYRTPGATYRSTVSDGPHGAGGGLTPDNDNAYTSNFKRYEVEV